MDTIREYREEQGLTQQQLAEIVGVCRATIARVENGRYPVSPSLAQKLHQLSGGVLDKAKLVFPDK